MKYKGFPRAGSGLLGLAVLGKKQGFADVYGHQILFLGSMLFGWGPRGCALGKAGLVGQG